MWNLKQRIPYSSIVYIFVIVVVVFFSYGFVINHWTSTNIGNAFETSIPYKIWIKYFQFSEIRLNSEQITFHVMICICFSFAARPDRDDALSFSLVIELLLW